MATCLIGRIPVGNMNDTLGKNNNNNNNNKKIDNAFFLCVCPEARYIESLESNIINSLTKISSIRLAPRLSLQP